MLKVRVIPTLLWKGPGLVKGVGFDSWRRVGPVLPAVKVYNTLELIRQRKVNTGELLLLVPRCLSRDALEGVLGVAKRYAVPVFVATRGQLARRVIRERRPRAVVAVACERDMVSGLHDVAGKVPVLGLVLKLPSGPCKDTVLDLVQLEAWVKAYVA